ncbi:Hypothetical predicted protein, partial [Pelobates cultripes]
MSEADHRKLLSLRSELTLLLQSIATKSLGWNKQLFYAQGNRCGKLLANALKQRQGRTYIPQIKTANNKTVQTNEEIANTFREFYHSLYNITKTTQNKEMLQTHLAYKFDRVLPQILTRSLDEPFTLTELINTVKSTPS